MRVEVAGAVGGYPGAAARRRIDLEVVGLEARPSAVALDGAELPPSAWSVSPSGRVAIRVPAGAVGRARRIELRTAPP